MDIEKLVEDGARLCAGPFDRSSEVRAVIALTLKAIIAEEANVTNGDILLAAGEMSASELRTVKAVLNWRVSHLRAIAAQVEKTNG